MTKTHNGININNITKIYNQNTPKPFVALDNISLEIPEGGALGLLGHNGAGKTTLIKIITTLLKPTFGKAKIGGFDLLENPTLIKYIVGYTTQDISLDPNINVIQTLELQSMYYGILQNKKMIDYLLDVTDLHNESKTAVRYLSGGMKRRLMIAKSLVQNPSIVILDEPTVGIDLVLKEKIISCIEELRNKGKTIILTTHLFDEVVRVCKSIAIFCMGQKVYSNDLNKIVDRTQDYLILKMDLTQSNENINKFLQSKKKEGQIIGYNLSNNTNIAEVSIANSQHGLSYGNAISNSINAPIISVSEVRQSKSDAIETLMQKYAKHT